MIDLHTHTFASDGELLPSELIRRAVAAGYRAIGITDHADETNMEDLVRRAVEASRAWKTTAEIQVIPGVEITHVPPGRIPELAAKARELGALLVVVHGETITEPVAPGTNAAAAGCPDVDILAHPGLISKTDAALAAENEVYLEITARSGHSAANGHVAFTGRASGASLILNTDAHAPGDLISMKMAETILAASGLDSGEGKTVFQNADRLLRIITSRGFNPIIHHSSEDS
ncbi:MAG: histidinol phosphate phosphatase domain-containing protein [Deltaproteobacteria bacterium]|nr:histidinol phosphate phosphatase domain-containing protein [Deltaproteobacteria bacterium]